MDPCPLELPAPASPDLTSTLLPSIRVSKPAFDVNRYQHSPFASSLPLTSPPDHQGDAGRRPRDIFLPTWRTNSSTTMPIVATYTCRSSSPKTRTILATNVRDARTLPHAQRARTSKGSLAAVYDIYGHQEAARANAYGQPQHDQRSAAFPHPDDSRSQYDNRSGYAPADDSRSQYDARSMYTHESQQHLNVAYSAAPSYPPMPSPRDYYATSPSIEKSAHSYNGYFPQPCVRRSLSFVDDLA